MKDLKEFTIPFIGLKIGEHQLDFKIENTFFEHFEYDEFNKVLINLASTEYSSVIDFKKLPGRVINIVFKNFNRGEYRAIGLLAKRARGMMADFIITNKITSVENLKNFAEGGYKFMPEYSSDVDFCFFSK